MAQITAQTAIDCYKDWRWRLNNLYDVIDERGEVVRFKMNWAQNKLFEEMHTLEVILKARQLGFTTFLQILMLDAAMFYPNVNCGTIAHTLNDAQEIFKNKVKFPYERLPEGLRNANPATEDSARKLSFQNGSSLVVGTSLRSGTFQYLHVSEFGKLCARYPDKAREVKTGAFNTVHPGQVIFVESTAEGQEGEFYDITERARALEREGAKLTQLDFKFHFFPWWQHPGYVLHDMDSVVWTSQDRAYFEKLRIEDGIELTKQQEAWYIKKAIQQGEEMKREFPSTPDEAFAASIEGAYYGREMAKCEEDNRIDNLPLDPSIGVETWWDLGMNDTMAIIWVQRVGPWVHVVDFYENSGEGFGHYARVLQDRQKERGYMYLAHVWPHDGNTRILDETGRTRVEVMRDLGYDVTVVQRGLITNGIEAVRNLLPKVRFDKERSADLVKALKNYRKEWDDDRGVFKNRPLHNWASHASDAMRCGAMFDGHDGSYWEGGKETPVPEGSYV